MTVRRLALEKPIVSRCLVFAATFLLAPAVRASGAEEARLVRRVCGDAAVAASRRAELDVGAAAVTDAGVLPNPSFVLQHQRTLDGPEDQETVVGLGIPLGIGGGRFKRQEAAEARQRAGRARGDVVALESAIDAQASWTRAALDQARVVVLERRQARIAELAAVLEGLERGGEAARHDRERLRVKDALHAVRLTEARARAAGSLASIRARGAASVAPALEEATLLAPSAPPPVMPSPRVDALAFDVEADETQADAARRAWVPDVDLFGGYRSVATESTTGHGIAVWLTIPVTLFDHGQGEAAVSGAEAQRGRAKIASERRLAAVADASLAARMASLADARSKASAASEVAERVALATRRLYEGGEASLTEVFDAFEDAEQADLARIDLLEAMAEARIHWMLARGTLLDPELARACFQASGEVAQ